MVEAVSRAATFLLWYKDPAQFYRDIYKEEPYPYQAQLLRDLADLSVDRVMVMAGGGLGKTKCLAAHALWCAAVLPRFIRKPISVIVIAGSEKQAKALYKYSKQAIEDTSELRSLVQGEPLQSLTEFRDRSCIKAVPNSLKAIQGEHDNIVIVDEAALAGDFVVQDTLRIVRGMNPNRIILLGTPTDYFSKFVEMWEDSERFPEWRRYHWSVYDCPAVDKRQLEEAKKTLSEEMFSVFVLGKPYAKTGTLIDHAKIKEACKDTPRFQVSERGKPPVAGIDWGWKHPTVLTIVQEVDGVYYVLHTEGWSREQFEKLHDRIAELCKLYQVETVYADAEDVGENQRLEARGLRVEPIPFNKEKTRMQSRMKGLFLQNRIRIPAEFTELIRQLRKYTWDTHEDDDYVDSLMLALRETEEEEEDIFFLKL